MLGTMLHNLVIDQKCKRMLMTLTPTNKQYTDICMHLLTDHFIS